MLKIRRPLGRLIFNMGIAIPGKTVFLIETAPCLFSNIVRFVGFVSYWSFVFFQFYITQVRRHHMAIPPAHSYQFQNACCDVIAICASHECFSYWSQLLGFHVDIVFLFHADIASCWYFAFIVILSLFHANVVSSWDWDIPGIYLLCRLLFFSHTDICIL